MASFERRTLQDGTTRWRYKVFVGTDRFGKRKFRSGTCDSKKEAEAEARKLEVKKDQSTLTVPSKENVATYLRRWLEDVKKGSIRQRTWDRYSGDLRRYVEDPPDGAPPIGGIRLDRLAPEHIQGLYGWLQREQGLSPKTIRGIHVVIRQGLAHAARTGAIGRNPAAGGLVVLPKVEKREVTAMSPKEANRFLVAASEDHHEAYFVLLLTGGLRPSEALGLKWPDVDFKESRVHVQRTLINHNIKGWKLLPPKTPRARRVVVLPDLAMRALRRWKAIQAAERLEAGPGWEDHGLVFTTATGGPLDITNLYARNFHRIMRRAGLGEFGPEPAKPRSGPTARRDFSPGYRMYDLRHSCATLLLRAGENPKVVSERLGHASVAFTLDVYTASLPDMQEGAARRLEEMLGGIG